MSNPILSWRRVRALCVKETRQIVRDPSSWLIAVVIPLLLLFIFGYGINLDSSKLRVGILLEQRSEAALDFTHTMTGSPYIDATISDNRQELIAKMQAGKKFAVWWLFRWILRNRWSAPTPPHRFR